MRASSHQNGCLKKGRPKKQLFGGEAPRAPSVSDLPRSRDVFHRPGPTLPPETLLSSPLLSSPLLSSPLLSSPLLSSPLLSSPLLSSPLLSSPLLSSPLLSSPLLSSPLLSSPLLSSPLLSSPLLSSPLLSSPLLSSPLLSSPLLSSPLLSSPLLPPLTPRRPHVALTRMVIAGDHPEPRSESQNSPSARRSEDGGAAPSAPPTGYPRHRYRVGFSGAVSGRRGCSQLQMDRFHGCWPEWNDLCETMTSRLWRNPP